MYVSYSNEAIDFFTSEIKTFEKVKNRLAGHEVMAVQTKHIENVRAVIKQIKSAVKFKIPACDQILADEEMPMNALKNFVEIANLPYSCICIEMKIFKENFKDEGGCSAIVIAHEDEDRIHVNLVYKLKKNWYLINRKKTGELITCYIDKKTCEAVMEGFEKNQDYADQHEALIEWFHDTSLRAVANLLCTLSCSNTSIEDSSEKPSKVKNDLRIQKKKLPFFEFKILTIDSGKNKNRESGFNGGTHASPRVHLRRGHIRRLSTKNVWVNACVVGDKDKGLIEKEYVVS